MPMWARPNAGPAGPIELMGWPDEMREEKEVERELGCI
jgi:hypothetical protein